MGDNSVSFIPRDPTSMPDPSLDAGVTAAVSAVFPQADSIAVQRSDEPEFFDAGENLESVTCPRCGTELPMDWWAEATSAAYEATQFHDLSVTTPCCSSATSLNDLDYDMPQGFASWAAVVLNPSRGPLSPDELADIVDAVGLELREIQSKY